MRRSGTRSAFSLVELVVVIVIIGIIAAMAIPRLSRGSAGASSSAVAGNLAVLRNAINLYAAEHNNKFPGHDSGDAADHLTMYTDASGGTSATRTGNFIFGPYIVAVPPMPIGNKSAPTGIAIDATNSPPQTTAGNDGWVYNPNTGEIIANTTDTDEAGKAFSAY